MGTWCAWGARNKRITDWKVRPWIGMAVDVANHAKYHAQFAMRATQENVYYVVTRKSIPSTQVLGM